MKLSKLLHLYMTDHAHCQLAIWGAQWHLRKRPMPVPMPLPVIVSTRACQPREQEIYLKKFLLAC